MAPKSDLSLFKVTPLLLLALFSFLSNATANSSPLEFLEHLKGCQKGDKVKGINDLKKYLHNFGYLNYKNHIHSDDDDFDELLEEAVKTYQLIFHLKSTGTLDDKTILQMMMPRCGVPDIVNGTTSMRSAKIKHQHATGAIAQAFATWARSTPFKFSQAQNYQNADIKISFHRGNHGDGRNFDGPGGVLAHAFYPTDGRFHFNAAENWSAGAKPGAYDLESVALHEIGHLLGLGHSSVKGAVMAATISPGVTLKSLNGDDIQGIKALYNV